MVADRFLAYTAGKFKGCLKGYYVSNIRCACFKFIRQVIIYDLIISNFFDHLSPALVYRHTFQQLHFTIEHTYTRRAIYLVGRKNKEITVKVSDINFQVNSG